MCAFLSWCYKGCRKPSLPSSSRWPLLHATAIQHTQSQHANQNLLHLNEGNYILHFIFQAKETITTMGIFEAYTWRDVTDLGKRQEGSRYLEETRLNCLSPSLTTHHLSSVAVLCQVRRASHLHVESTLNTGEERDPSRAAFSLLMANLLTDCNSSVLSSSLRMLSPATPPCCEHERLLCTSKGGNT